MKKQKDVGTFAEYCRAHDLSGAIGMHDGEARNTRFRWDQLSPSDREALIRFLQTL